MFGKFKPSRGAFILVVLGFVCLGSLPFWIQFTVQRQPKLEALEIQPIGSAFDEDPQIPSEEFRAKFNRATSLLDAYRVSLVEYRKQEHLASWAAFALTSLITIFAGYLGFDHALPVSESVHPENANHKTTHEKVGLGRPVALRLSRRHKRLAAVMGVLAALASISTALSNRLELQAEKQWKLAADLSSDLSAIRVEWYDAKTKEQALIVLGKLDSALLASVSE